MPEKNDTTLPGITQETAGKFWTAHREIANGHKLLEDLASRERDSHDKPDRRLLDAHQLLDLQPDLAEAVIKAHIRDCESQLDGLNALARREFSGSVLSAAERRLALGVVETLRGKSSHEPQEDAAPRTATTSGARAQEAAEGEEG